MTLGEQLIHDVYYALRNGPSWNGTLLIVTYDEHGGCYDHVLPPGNAVPPDDSAGEFGFDFTRFGPRVPAVLVSPLIRAGAVFRAPAGRAPMDHTCMLRTVQEAGGFLHSRRGIRAYTGWETCWSCGSPGMTIHWRA